MLCVSVSQGRRAQGPTAHWFTFGDQACARIKKTGGGEENMPDPRRTTREEENRHFLHIY